MAIKISSRSSIATWLVLLFFVVTWLNFSGTSLADGSNSAIYLGQPSALMVQPYIVAEVFAENPTVSGEYTSLGPTETESSDELGDLFREIYGSGFTVSDELLLGTPNSSLLLDTGANSIILVDTSAASVEEAAADLAGDETYQPAGTFWEMGIAGYHIYNVTAPYRFSATGSDGNPVYLENARIQTNPEGVLAASIDMGGIAGLAGMPVMTGRVTSITMTEGGTQYPSGAVDELGEWELIALLADGVKMNTTFSNAVPTLESDSQRVTIPLDNRISFAVEDGLPPDSEPGAPLPIYADVPFLTAQVSRTSPVDEVYREKECTFLFDTGAQFSMISRRTAFMLGLDENGNGNLNDEATEFLDVAGVGGTTQVPILNVDEIRVATEEETDLVWNDPTETIGVQVIVLDILPCADVNYDGVIDLLDTTLISSNYDTPIADLEFPMCDVDGNGTVEPFDLELAESMLNETVFFDGIFGIDMLTGGRSLVSSTPTETSDNIEELQAQIADMEARIAELDIYDLDDLIEYYTLAPQLAQAQLELLNLTGGVGSGDLVDAEFTGTTYFNAAHLDFRDWNTGSGKLVLDVASAYTEEESIPGDINGDGQVDGSDVTILANHWQYGVNEGETATPEMGDLNGDGQVDGSDVTILANHWQEGVSGTTNAAVPEPPVWALLISLGIFGLYRVSHRRKKRA